MKALSIKQPWAWLICKGYKDIENRGWPIGRSPQHGPYKSQRAEFTLVLPARVYVHAGKQHDYCDATFQFLIKRGHTMLKEWMTKEQFGAIIGEVDITGCVDRSASPWFVGKYGFTLANPELYEKPVQLRGQLGFFNISPEIEELCKTQSSKLS
jgi:hypothetical protein